MAGLLNRLNAQLPNLYIALLRLWTEKTHMETAVATTAPLTPVPPGRAAVCQQLPPHHIVRRGGAAL